MTEISTDRRRLDRDLVHGFLSTQAYWALGRDRATTERVIDGSLCFGAYADGGAQLGFARVVTDGALFGYVGDVFVLPEVRGRGIGKELLAAVLAHPDVRDLRRLVLLTDDAHALYERFGFGPLDDPRQWLQLRRG